MTDTKCSFMKLATENYDEICNSEINYCICCYGTTKKIKDSINFSYNLYWIKDNNNYTAGCTKCLIDAIIPGNYFINKNDNEICNQLDNWYKEGFTS